MTFRPKERAHAPYGPRLPVLKPTRHEAKIAAPKYALHIGLKDVIGQARKAEPLRRFGISGRRQPMTHTDSRIIYIERVTKLIRQSTQISNSNCNAAISLTQFLLDSFLPGCESFEPTHTLYFYPAFDCISEDMSLEAHRPNLILALRSHPPW
ncbi:hypothetical protein EV666_106152 [Camelimonas lactis]|uniref:Uncharacterized protein n=1 Tax=Camelimonas lactis TaxID=659006 RepID=A0A4R2GT97_9HYPH|nr:hypothetical protein EV666_106152 [Camelimonas lactis]